MILRKMIKNKWLELSLLFGLIFTVALSQLYAYLYTSYFAKNIDQGFAEFTAGERVYPGVFEYSASIGDNLTTDQKRAVFKTVDRFMEEQKNQVWYACSSL